MCLAFLMSLGFQLTHKTSCRGGGWLTRHSHYIRVRLGGVSIWRIQCTTCRAVFTLLPPFSSAIVRQPEAARAVPLRRMGGLSLELCAVIAISPMALYRSSVPSATTGWATVLTRCRLPLPTYVLADEKHTPCPQTRSICPLWSVAVCPGIWGTAEDASAAAFHPALSGRSNVRRPSQEPAYRVRGILPMALTVPSRSCGCCSRERVSAPAAPRAQQAPEETGSDHVAGP